MSDNDYYSLTGTPQHTDFGSLPANRGFGGSHPANQLITKQNVPMPVMQGGKVEMMRGTGVYHVAQDGSQTLVAFKPKSYDDGRIYEDLARGDDSKKNRLAKEAKDRAEKMAKDLMAEVASKSKAPKKRNIFGDSGVFVSENPDGDVVISQEKPDDISESDGSGLDVRGTPGPGKVACARQYESDAPDAAIIPAGSESGLEHWFLTYDYQRSVAL